MTKLGGAMLFGHLVAGRRVGLPALVAVAAALIVACAHPGPSTFDTDLSAFAGDDAGTIAVDAWTCVGLQCRQMICPDGRQTSVSGIVTTPSANYGDPIYNALVYVPNSPVEPFSAGVSCDRCGAVASGSPIAATLSGADGHFVLTNVPVGDAIPIVIQVGRWRRQFTLPTVEPCTDNPLPAGLTHLPQNHLQGDIPRIAIATGAVDPLECLLRKIGIDDSEFTAPSGEGRVHVYTSNGASMTAGAAGAAGAAASAGELWGKTGSLEKYDIVLLPCEGLPIPKPASALKAIIDYTAAGGRVFTTHYGYEWIEGAPSPFSSTALWADDEGVVPDPLAVDVNTSFPKGAAMSEWLSDQGVLNAMGQLSLEGSRRDATQTRGASVPWLTSPAPESLQEYTFNTPVNAPATQQCGRVAYSDFHVTLDGLSSTTLATFPDECLQDTLSLSAQEKVIEFMLFDLASCIQLDTDPTPVPSN